MPNLKEIDTYLGKLKVGDSVLLSWIPNPNPSQEGTSVEKVISIFKGNSISLNFERIGKEAEHCFTYNGDILGHKSLLAIYPQFTTWKEEMKREGQIVAGSGDENDF
jgi:hypothetical protein